MGTKSAPSVPPDGPETKAFRAIILALKNDKLLSLTTNTFISWTDDDQDMYEPTWSLCPFLKVSPAPAESGWITEGQHLMPMVLQVQVATQGTGISNLLNYWNLIRLAIFPQVSIAAAEAVRDPLTEAGITKPTILLNGYAHREEDEGLRILIAVGTIRFGMLIGT